MLPATEYNALESAALLRDIFFSRGIPLDESRSFPRNPYGSPRARQEAEFHRSMAAIRGMPRTDQATDEGGRQDESIFDYLDREYDFGGGPDEVRAYIDGGFPLDVETCIKFADYLGCQVRDFSPYHQEQIDHIAAFAAIPDDLEDLEDQLERLRDRMGEMAKALPRWLGHRHETVKRRVVGNVRSFYQRSEPPEAIEGVEDGLDYFAILKFEGIDNGLYEIAIDGLDGAIWQEILNLDEDDQIALLLPLCAATGYDSDMRELVLDTDWTIQEWPEVLRRRFSHGWTEPMREHVLECIEPRSRVDSSQVLRTVPSGQHDFERG